MRNVRGFTYCQQAICCGFRDGLRWLHSRESAITRFHVCVCLLTPKGDADCGLNSNEQKHFNRAAIPEIQLRRSDGLDLYHLDRTQQQRYSLRNGCSDTFSAAAASSGSDRRAVPKQNPSTPSGAPIQPPPLKDLTRSLHPSLSRPPFACAHVISAAQLGGGGALGGSRQRARELSGRIPAVAAALIALDVCSSIRRLHTETSALLLLPLSPTAMRERSVVP